MLGVAVTYIAAGKFKSEMNPDQPLSAEARDYEQSRVNDYYQMFTKAVARGRAAPIGDVREKMGQGRVLGAKDALAAGMIDGIDTLPGVIARAQGPRPAAGSTGAMARAALAQASRAECEARIQASIDGAGPTVRLLVRR